MYNFKKDFLLVDVEATGLDITKHEIVQIAGLLLDKQTLEEKQRFVSYIKPQRWEQRDPEAMVINQLDLKILEDAPELSIVLQQFFSTFPNDIIPTSYGGSLDFTLLPAACQSAGIPYPYDYHVFNLWPLCYWFMAQRNKLNNPKKFVGFELEDVARELGINPPAARHDAMVDCELEADVMHKLFAALS